VRRLYPTGPRVISDQIRALEEASDGFFDWKSLHGLKARSSEGSGSNRGSNLYGMSLSGEAQDVPLDSHLESCLRSSPFAPMYIPLPVLRQMKPGYSSSTAVVSSIIATSYQSMC
jgi:hypothetical protein